ncbi:alpha/beta hydrolase [Serratia bockelmannii]|uniref:RBBP9/YdeN family alpha/beta hydrolase n=1 Tax=Serratia bockelmannii TaxID=2703793 RepID=UPI00313C87A9
MNNKRIVVVHGYTASPKRHWFPWLMDVGHKNGYEVLIPELPDSDNPELDKWLLKLKCDVGVIDNNTWVVGHSLGCITALKYLANQSESDNPAGIIMVSGFKESLELLPQLNEFTASKLNFDRIVDKIKNRFSIISLNDNIVLPEQSLRFSQKIDAYVYGVPGCGHFLDIDGVTSLPLLTTIFESYS